MVAQYPLQALLRVRQFRENAAEHGVRSAEATLARAQEKKQQREQALAEYRVWRVHEEDRRYAAIMGTTMSLEEVDAFKAGLTALALQEREREEAMVDAELERQKAENAVDEAKAVFAAARKDTLKIDTHKDIWLSESRLEAEKAEEREMEDFHVLPHLNSAEQL